MSKLERSKNLCNRVSIISFTEAFFGLIRLCHTEDLPAMTCFPIGIYSLRVSQSNQSSSSSTIVAPPSAEIYSSAFCFSGASGILFALLWLAETNEGSVAELEVGLIVRETPEPTAEGALIIFPYFLSSPCLNKSIDDSVSARTVGLFMFAREVSQRFLTEVKFLCEILRGSLAALCLLTVTHFMSRKTYLEIKIESSKKGS